MNCSAVFQLLRGSTCVRLLPTILPWFCLLRTDWPSWEDLSTVVNDLSEENFLDQLDERIPFGAGSCSASVHQNPGKWTDNAVETKKEGRRMHARLYFCEKVIPMELAEELGDLHVANVKTLSKLPGR